MAHDDAAIRDILPHREPFLFVDRLVSFDEDRLVAEKDLPADAPFFAGHFPGRPVMPGVLILEALAQASGLLLGLSGREGFFFLAASDVRFLRPCGPGETLRLTSRLKKGYAGLFLFDATASVGEEPAARGSLTLALERA